MSSVTAIVVTYESADVLGRCLAALSGEVAEVIVVDNASTDGSCAIAEAAGVRLIRNARNEGYGRGNNIGIRAADGADWCLIVNPDLTLQPGAVAAMMAAVARHPGAMLLGPRLVEPDGRVQFRTTSLITPDAAAFPPNSMTPTGDVRVAMLSGACLLVRRDVFLALGGFDEQIFLFYEDDDLCQRARAAGHVLVYVHDAVTRHLRGGSSSPTPGRVFRSRYHQAWSRAYVCRKHGRPAGTVGEVVRNATKLPFAWVTRDRDRIERYQGSVAGGLAALAGWSALKREGLT